MSRRPDRLQRLMHRWLMWQPVSAALAYILEPADRWMDRLTGGRHTFTGWVGLPIIKLETIGARSGLRRVHFLLGLQDGDRLVVIGSNFGRPHHPAWVHNLRAHPQCRVHVHGRSRLCRARELEGEERERLWQLALEYYQGYAAYARRAAPRRITVWSLEPLD